MDIQDSEAVFAHLKERGTETFSEIYDHEGMYKLCYLRGHARSGAGIILELAEQIG